MQQQKTNINVEFENAEINTWYKIHSHTYIHIHAQTHKDSYDLISLPSDWALLEHYGRKEQYTKDSCLGANGNNLLHTAGVLGGNYTFLWHFIK